MRLRATLAIPHRCPACMYELPRAPAVECPECGRRWADAEIEGFWKLEILTIRRAERNFLYGAVGFSVWALSLAGVAAAEGEVPSELDSVGGFALAGVASGVAWLVLRWRLRSWASRPFRPAWWLTWPAGIAGGFGLFFGAYSAVPLLFLLLSLVAPW